jgi:ribonuclease HI
LVELLFADTLASVTPQNDRLQHPSESDARRVRKSALVNDDGHLDDRIAAYSDRLGDILEDNLGMVGFDDPDSAALNVTVAIQSASEAACFTSRLSQARKPPSPKVYGWNSECQQLSSERDKHEYDLNYLRLLPSDARPPDYAVKIQMSRDAWSKCDLALGVAIQNAKRNDWVASCSKFSVTTPVSEAFGLLHRLSGPLCGTSVSSSTLPPMKSRVEGSMAFTPGQQAAVLAEYWGHRCSFDHPDNETFDSGHFRRVETLVADDRFYNPPAGSESNVLYVEQNCPFSAPELDDALSHIRSSAPGRDGIVKSFLKWGGEPLTVELLRLYNLCLTEGRFPSMWKIASIIPLPKVARPTAPAHFRPISLLPALGKILEHLIRSRLTWILLITKSQSPEQTAYSSHRSTVHQLLRIVNAAKGAWGKKCHVVMVSFDIARAFDTVWHDGLLYRLKSIGVVGNLLRLIASFLSDRMGRARVGDTESTLFALPLGVPQGSVLGPCLWNVYFNYIGSAIGETSPGVAWGAYADDLCVWMNLPLSGGARSKAMTDLQRVLDAIGEWAKTWRLAFDPKKSSLMIFSPRGTPNLVPANTWFLLGTPLTLTEQSRVLGVILDSGLTFRAHISNIKDRASLRLHVLRRLSSTSWGGDMLTLRQLYVSWVRPVLEYASPVWSLASQKLLHQLDIVQNDAVRICLGVPRAANLATLHWDCELEYLASRRLQAGARLACSLDRLPHSSACAADWRAWVSQSTNLPPPPVAKSTLVGYYHPKTASTSPMYFLFMSLRYLGLDQSDLVPENFEDMTSPLFCPPWQPPLPPVLKSHCPDWPVTGSAGHRTAVQDTVATNWSRDLYNSLSLLASTVNRRLVIAHTDGSVIQNDLNHGGLGVAWTFPSPGAPALTLADFHRVDLPVSIPVGGVCDALLVELGAIWHALSTVSGHVTSNGLSLDSTLLAIVTDSQSAIKLLTSPVTPSSRYLPGWQLRNMIDSTIIQLQSKGLLVTVEWIPSHVDFTANTVADRAAKDAATASSTGAESRDRLPRPYRLLQKATRKLSKASEKLSFSQLPVADTPRLHRVTSDAFYPPMPLATALRITSRTCKLTSRPPIPRATEVCLARLRCGAEIRPSVLRRKNIPCNGNCPRCDLANGFDFQHLLFDCASLNPQRISLLSTLNQCSPKIDFNRQNILGFDNLTGTNLEPSIRAISTFLTATKLDALWTHLPP